MGERKNAALASRQKDARAQPPAYGG